MKTLQERLIWARTQKSDRDGSEFTQQDLANKAGVTQGNIAHLESGRSKTSRNLTKIATALGVNAEWLGEGKGPPFPDHSSSQNSVAHGVPVTIDPPMTGEDRPSRVQIRKVLDLKLSAGITGFQLELDPGTGGQWDLPARWLAKKRFSPEDLFAIEVKGESMEPNLYDGDVVIVNTSDTTPVSGEVFAINYEGEAVIKRMMRDGGQWYLCSDNPSPRYGRRSCRGYECIIIGKVVRRETDYV